jgi:hypothetical protein
MPYNPTVKLFGIIPSPPGIELTAASYGFVVKVSADMGELLYSSYLGGHRIPPHRDPRSSHLLRTARMGQHPAVPPWNAASTADHSRGASRRMHTWTSRTDRTSSR